MVNQSKKRSLIRFFGLAYGISWMLWLPLYLPYFGITFLPVLPLNHALGALGPLLASFIMTYKEEGRKGMQSLTRSMSLISAPHLFLVALTGPFVLLMLSAFIHYMETHTWIAFDRIGLTEEFPQISFLGYFLYNLFFFGYGEETGWKGFALPRLQAKFSALAASIIFTLFWAAWHFPLFFYRAGYTSMGFAEIAGWLFSLLTGSILLTWLFNSSKGSIFLCAVFHATIDIAFVSDATNEKVTNYLGTLITLWGILTITVLILKNKERIRTPLSALHQPSSEKH